MTEITQGKIDAIANEKHDMIVERMTQSGHGDEMRTVVDKLLSDGDNPLKLPGWHVANGMRDVRKLDPQNKRKAIDLTYAQRCIAWAEAAVECGEELNSSELEEYELCKKIWGTSLFVLEDGSVVWLDVPAEHHIRESDGALHNAEGPAILFADGSKTYAVDDIFNIPEWVVETPAEKMDPSEVIKLENVDHRRVAVEKIGVEKMLDGAKLLDTDSHDKKYKLYDMVHLFEGVEDVESALHLKMECVSGQGVCVEGVSDDCKTVQDALNFRGSGAGNIKWRPCSIDGQAQPGGIVGQQQQGDVNTLGVDKIPNGFVAIKKRTVLSDANQIRHTITSGTLYQKGDDQSLQYWEIDKKAELQHPEHGAEKFGPGIVKLWPVVQKNHVSGLVEAVLD